MWDEVVADGAWQDRLHVVPARPRTEGPIGSRLLGEPTDGTSVRAQVRQGEVDRIVDARRPQRGLPPSRSKACAALNRHTSRG
jgi:hypothetical protein